MAPNRYNDNSETDRPTERPPQTEINSVDLRLSVDEACKLMDNAGYQPRGYERYLNVTYTPRWKNPHMIGQSAHSNANLWWQTNAAGDIYERKTRAQHMRLKNIQDALESGSDTAQAMASALKGVEMGAILADEVGIGA